MSLKIELDEKKLQLFCNINSIKKLSFFGSVLTDKFDKESDVDILVEFYENFTPGFLGFAKMERELSEIIGRKADLRTKEELSEYFRDSVVKEAVIKYGA